ncbi:hypothetical protein [Streptomyces adelaidensis]|uniref:hypothetical protein n=1 Tax=Streptomyces adelaidensis TaxID=2796465 RepID=UPI001903318F|nr:hypothetical protein [Streptomyces adelaidensis]
MKENLAIGALVVVLIGSLLYTAYRLIDRARRRAITRDRMADARARVGLPPAAPDNVPGVNAADIDECALILSLPTYGTDDHTTNPTGDPK